MRYYEIIIGLQMHQELYESKCDFNTYLDMIGNSANWRKSQSVSVISAIQMTMEQKLVMHHRLLR